MSDYDQLSERWKHSPWREAIEVLADPNCTKDEFNSMIQKLYPEGGENHRSQTHRGIAELLDCRGVDLSHRDLRNADFYKIDLSGGNLSDSNIDGATFGTAQLMDADLSHTVASNHVNFHGCFGVRTNFSEANFLKGAFSGADLSNSNFSNAILNQCDFSGAILREANLAGARMTDCDVQGTRLSEKERESEWFKQSSFRNAEHIVWEK